MCQADDPFVCFGAKPDKGFGLKISDGTVSRQGKASQSLTKELRGGSWRRARQKGSWQSTPDREDTSRREIGSSSSEGRPVKMSQHC